MTPTIKPLPNMEIKSLLLTLLLSAFISETAQAQSIPRPKIPTITIPKISIVQPTISVPIPTVTIPRIPTQNISTISVPITTVQIPTPSVINIPNNQPPTEFKIQGTSPTRPSFVSAIKRGTNEPEIKTGTGSVNIDISTTVSSANINVVIPSNQIVAPADVNFNVTTAGSLITNTTLSFPIPALD